MVKRRTATGAPVKVPSEALEAGRLVDWLKSKNLRYSHIANEAVSRVQRIKNARAGVVAGVPDFLILLPGFGVCWIELKRQKRGRTSPEQKAWIDALNALPGQFAAVCNGYEEAKAFILRLLDERTNGI